MDRQILENLLLDHALQALPLETDSLLQAYLADHPDVASHATGLRETTRLAETVLKQGLESPLPALLTDRLVSADTQTRRRFRLQRVGLIAACVVAGFALGRNFRTASTIHTTTVRERPPAGWAANAPINLTQPQPVSSDGDFWSARRLYQRATEARPANSSRRVIWGSPFATPKTGDAT